MSQVETICEFISANKEDVTKYVIARGTVSAGIEHH